MTARRSADINLVVIERLTTTSLERIQLTQPGITNYERDGVIDLCQPLFIKLTIVILIYVSDTLPIIVNTSFLKTIR